MSKNVLIVDDIAMNRKLLKAIISKTLRDVTIIEAEDGYKALDIIKNEDISVVILDIMMPGKDGIEVLSEIKSNVSTQNLPVIMCSAISEIDNVEKALSLGALDYFTKPLSEEQMRVTLPLKVKNAIEYYENKNQLIRFYEHISDEMKLAEQIQKALISAHSDYPQVEMWGRYIPCEQVGGDIFCVKQFNDILWFMIADISGHGISAAMVSIMLNVIFNTSVESCNTPDSLLNKINSVLFEIFRGSNYGLISAFAGYIKGNDLCYVNAGHPYPIMYHGKTKTIQQLNVNGFLLGMFENCDLSACCEHIESDDALLLFTDGLFDKGINKGYAGWDKVIEYCTLNIDKLSDKKDEFLNGIIEHFSTDEGRSFIDDVAVMLLRKK